LQLQSNKIIQTLVRLLYTWWRCNQVAFYCEHFLLQCCNRIKRPTYANQHCNECKKRRGVKTNLLQEVLPIISQEDPYMIRLLSRQNYIDIVKTTKVGW
jgi:hypothetical protein